MQLYLTYHQFTFFCGQGAMRQKSIHAILGYSYSVATYFQLGRIFFRKQWMRLITAFKSDLPRASIPYPPPEVTRHSVALHRFNIARICTQLALIFLHDAYSVSYFILWHAAADHGLVCGAQSRHIYCTMIVNLFWRLLW